MGIALAENLAHLGAYVYLVLGPVQSNIQSNNSIQRIDVHTAEEMYIACQKIFPSCKGAILAAAVADYRPAEISTTKMKKTGKNDDEIVLNLVKNKDILASLGKVKSDNQILVGFSLETHNEEDFALAKMQRKNCDFIVMNSLNTKGAGFGVDTNEVKIFSNKGISSHISLRTKKEVASDIVDFMIKHYI